MGSLVLVLLLHRRFPRGLWLAAGIALAVALPWHLLAYGQNPTAFLDFTLRLHFVDQIGRAQPWSTGGPLFYLSSIATHDLLLGVAMVVGLAVAGRSLCRAPLAPLGHGGGGGFATGSLQSAVGVGPMLT